MKQRLFIVGITIILIAITAVLYRWVHWAFLFIVILMAIAWYIWASVAIVEYYYYTKRKELKKYRMSKAEHLLIDALQKSSCSTNNTVWDAMIKTMEERHKVQPGTLEWMNADLSIPQFFGIPKKPF